MHAHFTLVYDAQQGWQHRGVKEKPAGSAKPKGFLAVNETLPDMFQK